MRKVFFNTAVQLGGRALSIGIGLFTLRLTATYLGVDVYGEYSIVLAVAGTAVIAAELGVTSILAREISKYPDDADHLGGILFRFRLVTVVPAVGILAALIPFLPYNHDTKIALFVSLPGVAALILGSFPNAFFQANLRLEYAAALDVGARVLGLVAILLVRVFDLGLIGFVALVAASYLITCVVTFLLSGSFWRINMSFDWERAKPLIRAGVGVGFASTIGLLVYRGDAILLLKTPRDVGIYTVAYRFVDQAFLLPGMFIATVFPIMTRTLHTDKAAAQRVINRVFEFLVLAGIATTLFVYTLAPFLVRVVAGNGFSAAVHPLRILSLAITLLFASPVFYNVLLARDWQRDLVLIGILLLIWDVSTNLVLIPRYGYNGAAVATIATQTFGLLILFAAARRREPFRIDWTFLVRAAGAVAPAVLAVYLLRSQSQWAAFVTAELAFGVAAILFGAVKRADLRRLIARATG
jgi:O-antigen/teichoic acid export membrane protein